MTPQSTPSKDRRIRLVLLYRNASVAITAGVWVMLFMIALDRLRDSGIESLTVPIVATAVITSVAAMAWTISGIVLATLRAQA